MEDRPFYAKLLNIYVPSGNVMVESMAIVILIATLVYQRVENMGDFSLHW